MLTLNSLVSKARRKIKSGGHAPGNFLFPNNEYVKKAKGLRILVYHGICRKDPFRFNTLFLTIKKFEKQLLLYKKYFDIISLDDVYAHRYNPDRFSVCLTFDDGFLNNYKYVLPLLEEYRVPAGFFITSITEAGYDFLWNDILSIAGKMGPSRFVFRNEEYARAKNGQYRSAITNLSLNEVLRGETFEAKKELIETLTGIMPFGHRVHEDYWKQMTKKQIRELASSKWVTLGSHSFYHNDLAKCTGLQLVKDLEQSKHFLESIIDKEVNSLAFPYGSYDSHVLKQAKHAGYSRLLATECLLPGDECDPMLKQRLTINPFIAPINQVYANISGTY